VQELIPLGELSARYTSGVVIRVREDVHTDDTLTKLREIVRGYPGQKSLKLLLALTDGGSVTIDCAKCGVTLDPELRRRVEDLLGPGNFKLVAAAVRNAPPPPASANGRRRAMARN
jgi:DNA polymerase-3 subunit alpha